MLSKKLIFFILIFGLAVQKIYSFPVAKGSLDWKTLESKNFYVHFPAKQKSFAKKAIQLFEKEHKRMAPLYAKPWQKYKTNVSLTFTSDITQGWATTLGIDQIVLYLESPPIGTFSRYSNWLRLLFVHEYAHILSLRIWLPEQFTLAFVRLLVGFPPNLLSPLVFSEGVATWEESKTGQGRLNDPLAEMIVRTAVLENIYPSFREMLVPYANWPGGRIAYLYGARFMQSLEDIKGKEAPRDYWNTNHFPVWLNQRLADIGSHITEIYNHMRKKDERFFGKQISQLLQKKVNSYQRLTFDGYHKSHLKYNPQKEDTLLYFARPKDKGSGVYQFQEKSQPKLIRTQLSNRGIAWQGKRILYSSDKLLSFQNGIRYELYDGNRSYLMGRLSPGRSIQYPSLSSDQKKVYFVEKTTHQRFLKIANLKDGDLSNEKIIAQVPFDGILESTSLSPNGKFLAFIYRKKNTGYASLVLCDIKKENKETIKCYKRVQGKAVLTQTAFSLDSKKLFFSSDTDRIYNLYSLSLDKEGKIYQISKTTGGFFYPTPGKKALYAIAYFGNGFDLVSIPYQNLFQIKTSRLRVTKEKLPPITSPLYPKEKNEKENLDSELFQEKNYASILNWKLYYTGLLDIGKVGRTASDNSTTSVVAFGGFEARDPLHWHIIGLSTLIANGSDPEEKIESEEEDRLDIPAHAYYIYNRFSIGFSASYLRSNDFRENKQAYITHSSLGRFISSQILLGYKTLDNFFFDEEDYSTYDDFSEHRRYHLEGPSTLWIAGKAEFYPRSISPEDGWRFFATSQYFQKEKSNITYYQRQLDSKIKKFTLPIEYGINEGGLALFLPSLFKRHVNYLSAYGYQYFGSDKNYRLQVKKPLARNSDPKAQNGEEAQSYTYEYRFPLYYPYISKGWSWLSLRYLSLATFYDYTKIKNRREDYQTWAYGFKLGIASNLLYFPLPTIEITYAKGKNDHNLMQIGFSLNTSFSLGTENKSRNYYRYRLVENYRYELEKKQGKAGYFHDSGLLGY